jgi:hypothetical protein
VEPQARADELRDRVASHKAAIRRERAALVKTAAELARFEKECASRGIRLVNVNAKGEGDHPWPNSDRSSTSTP